MRPDRLLLEDILDAIGEVLDVTPASRAEFDKDKLVRSHVLRHIQIIGEAASRLSAELKERHPEAPGAASRACGMPSCMPTSRSTGTRSTARRPVMCPHSSP